MTHDNYASWWDRLVASNATPLPAVEVLEVRQDENFTTYEISYPAARQQGGAA